MVFKVLTLHLEKTAIEWRYKGKELQKEVAHYSLQLIFEYMQTYLSFHSIKTWKFGAVVNELDSQKS